MRDIEEGVGCMKSAPIG